MRVSPSVRPRPGLSDPSLRRDREESLQLRDVQWTMPDAV